jgi:hypothetical protein
MSNGIPFRRNKTHNQTTNGIFFRRSKTHNQTTYGIPFRGNTTQIQWLSAFHSYKQHSLHVTYMEAVLFGY